MSATALPSASVLPAALDGGLTTTVARDGFCLLRGETLLPLLGAGAEPDALEEFCASWNRLEVDKFMADGGRYRRRRHANFTTQYGVPGHVRGPHQPHFQAVVHNSLNGGVERWFAPVEDEVAEGATLQAVLNFGRKAVDTLDPGQNWFIEMHQFRIEAAAGLPGYPTPEGAHHDGVDFVLIAMIERTNLQGGETLIVDDSGKELARFTLQNRLDSAFVQDPRVRHGVSPIQPTDTARPSCRDVLVLTWKRKAA